jgi:hypothetical protein
MVVPGVVDSRERVPKAGPRGLGGILGFVEQAAERSGLKAGVTPSRTQIEHERSVRGRDRDGGYGTRDRQYSLYDADHGVLLKIC